MNRAEIDAFCATLPATAHVVQWGNSDVWKVGGKLFAVCGWHENDAAFTFNTTYQTYFPEDRRPARTTVGVTALAVGALVEIDCVARRP